METKVASWEIDNIVKMIKERGRVRKYYLSITPLDFFIDLFLKNGFEEHKNAFSKYGKSSISLERKAYKSGIQRIHVKLRDTGHNKLIDIHGDIPTNNYGMPWTHNAVSLNHELRVYMCNLLSYASS